MDQKFNARFDGIDQRFHGIDQKFEGVDQKFERIDRNFESVNQAIAATRLWGISTLVTFTAVILATMARGFDWL